MNMSVLFSRQCEYAIQGVLYLAKKPAGDLASLRELANELHIPYHFLGKILQRLAHKGLLISFKGPAGGFALGMLAQDITLFHVVEAIDGTDFTKMCLLGFAECSSEFPCSVHDQWSSLRESLYKMLAGRNIAELTGCLTTLELSSRPWNSIFS